ncbi:dienelactone hydrolase family protein [Chitinibacter sp. S2-10]|uniref:dienelactone hydrolase family protein n=1 Tax=Chitinibacter sp. S2-10 TaxID=3373597 RepID=UPI0039776C70
MFTKYAVAISALATLSVAAEQPPLRADLNEKVYMLQVDKNFLGISVELETTVFKPDGDGPFPLVVINEGKSFGNPAFQPRARYSVLAEELVARGYAVALPMPRGFSNSNGSFTDYGCQIDHVAQKQGADLRRVINELKKQPYINADKIIVAGQSYGGVNTLATVAEPIAGVQLALNFAGGVKYMSTSPSDTICDWQKSLVSAMGNLGEKTQVESIWFYGKNDSLFPPELATQMHAAYTQHGAKSQLIQYGDFRTDAHAMFGTLEGFQQIWWSKLSPILQTNGFPTERKYPPQANAVKPSGYAKIDEVDKLPAVVSSACRDKYTQIIQEGVLPRAIAFSVEGNCGWQSDYDDPAFWAITACKSISKSQNCQLYAIDNAVVWPVKN